ncbi:unnamed protein product [Phytophthora fragariaefolia]|uniref:Unnamed protein product n=1 Tax=Phytophthora fragariaefolia TaxID=1490495 RepID=A0A9W7D325_9STRA|nr:unnamed protein product [Phytophthora fragariaefolia]
MTCMFTLEERDGSVKTDLFLEYPSTLEAAGAGPPAGDAVERVDIGHAVSKPAAPSESHSHCKKKDDKPNLVIQKVNSKRESSLRALVDCGASNNFVRLQRLARLDFEEVELPRSLLDVRLATGVVVRTEKRVVRARFSYEEKEFVDELIVLDLDDKFDIVFGMPWLARHDPVIDWAKRTIVRFRIPHEQQTAQARQAAQVSVRDRDAACSVCRTDTATADNRRDPECLDAYGYRSPESEDGAREPSDASVGVDFTSSYELEAFRPQPARWTHRADLHPLGRRVDEK